MKTRTIFGGWSYPPKQNSLSHKLLRGLKQPRNEKQRQLSNWLKVQQRQHLVAVSMEIRPDLITRRQAKDERARRHVLSGRRKHKLAKPHIQRGNPMPC